MHDLYISHRTLMVLGAGRGPLVTASLQAADKAERQIKVYAVEKNPNAIVTYVLGGNYVRYFQKLYFSF